MKKTINITFEIDGDDENDIDLIIDYLTNEFPSVIGNGEVFIESFEIEKLN